MLVQLPLSLELHPTDLAQIFPHSNVHSLDVLEALAACEEGLVTEFAHKRFLTCMPSLMDAQLAGVDELLGALFTLVCGFLICFSLLVLSLVFLQTVAGGETLTTLITHKRADIMPGQHMHAVRRAL